jgi:hypothetical protein
MSEVWPPLQPHAILAARRRLLSGEREQWTVSRDARGLTVRCLRLHPGGLRHETEEVIDTQGLADALPRFPELRTLTRGTITGYQLEEDELEPPVLASMLAVDMAGGPEAAEDWPDGVGEEWGQSDAGLLGGLVGGLEWFPRWARINGIRVSAVEITTPHGDVMQPVLADEDEEELVWIREIARSIWHSESDGAPIIWTGGHTLSLLAPGIGYSQPYEDSWETVRSGCELLWLPDDPSKLGMVLVDWVSGTESDVAAALALEPLDVDGELSDAERQTWDDRLGAVTVKFEMDVSEQARRSLRESLAERSELYRRTRADLMHPRSQDGQALAAALDTALDDGAVDGLLMFGGMA